MKKISCTFLNIPICLGVLAVLISSCNQTKSNDFKILHLLPYEYEGVMVCKSSKLEDTNGIYTEINGDTITLRYNKNGIADLIIDVEGSINIKEEMVYWVDSLDNRMDSVMFINYGIGIDGREQVYLVTRKAKDEITVDRILEKLNKDRLHNKYPPRLHLNNHKLSDTLKLGPIAKCFTIDNKLIWLE